MIDPTSFLAAVALGSAAWQASPVGPEVAQQSPPPQSSAPGAPHPPSTAVTGVTVQARRPTHVAGVVVTATDWCPEPNPARYPATQAPAVVDSYPRQGAAAAPGLALVRVSFDAPMSCYSEVTEEGGTADPCEPQGTWALPDRRSFILQCRLQPMTHYSFRFSKADGEGFVGLSGRPAQPFTLSFDTTDAAPVATVAQAQAADPGAPDAASVSAYVTCTDRKLASAASDCSHERFAKPRP